MSERRERYSPLSSSTSLPPFFTHCFFNWLPTTCSKALGGCSSTQGHFAEGHLSEMEQEYKESVLHCNKGRELDRRGGQARLADVMESAHLMSYSSEVKYHKPKRITAHLALFDLLLFTTSSTLCTTADYLIISPQVCSQHENTCIL